jgi:DNA-binding transcriptional LysR family regulator
VQIKQLEQELGTTLFDRIGRQIRLTEHGERFVPYAANLLQAAQEANNFLLLDAAPSGKLRLGTCDSLLTDRLPPILLEFTRKYPQVETEIHTDAQITTLFQMLHRNEIDILYCMDKTVNSPDWVKVLEQPEPVVFVARGDNPLAKEQNISLQRLAEEPLLLTTKDVSYRYELDQLLAAKGLAPRPILEAGNTVVLTDLLLQGAGISFLPRFSVQKYLDRGELCILHTEAPPMEIRSQLVYHKNKWVTSQMERFLELMQLYLSPKEP